MKTPAQSALEKTRGHRELQQRRAGRELRTTAREIEARQRALEAERSAPTPEARRTALERAARRAEATADLEHLRAEQEIDEIDRLLRRGDLGPVTRSAFERYRNELEAERVRRYGP